jgi:cytochrome c553
MKKWRIHLVLVSLVCLVLVAAASSKWANGMMGQDGMHEMMDGMMQTTKPVQQTNSDSPGALALQEICSQCHALPDPARHTSQEWPAVVERMNGYMKSMGKPVPDEQKLRDIVKYLQSQAS